MYFEYYVTSTLKFLDILKFNKFFDIRIPVPSWNLGVDTGKADVPIFHSRECSRQYSHTWGLEIALPAS
jgi:hypothetical protein